MSDKTNEKIIKTGAPQSAKDAALKNAKHKAGADLPKEIGGYADMGKPEPTRYGDWETNGRCTDF